MAIKITNLGFWERYYPSPAPVGAPDGAMFSRRVSDGVDWYKLAYDQKSFPTDALLATALPVSRTDGVSGNIISAVQRIETVNLIFPSGQWLFQIEGVPTDETAPHKLFEQQNFDPEALTIEPFPPIKAPVITYKREMWARMTDQEADTLDADLMEQSAKIRRQFQDAQYIDHSDPLFQMMWDAIAGHFGAERANAILASSEM